jgi:hypothetical protein
MSLKSVDDLLVKVQQNEPVTPSETASKAEDAQESVPVESNRDKNDTQEDKGEEKLTHLEQFRKDKEEFLSKEPEESTKTDDKSHQDDVNDNSHDDYGNEVPKSKMYTEEEVQAMIRKRLKLRAEEQQPQQQPYQDQRYYNQQQPPDVAQSQQGEEPGWEVQLENHIKHTVQKMEADKQEHAWQAEQQRAQADFETRFTGGMAKYADFSDVVAGKPITNGIMMAARSMQDPAAFIYAAAKQQPKELERIAQITDPYVLAAEVGRLEERMRKARTVTKAPKPLTLTKGDMADKGNVRQNLDDLIRADAKRKLGRR